MFVKFFFILVFSVLDIGVGPVIKKFFRYLVKYFEEDHQKLFGVVLLAGGEAVANEVEYVVGLHGLVVRCGVVCIRKILESIILGGYPFHEPIAPHDEL